MGGCRGACVLCVCVFAHRSHAVSPAEFCFTCMHARARARRPSPAAGGRPPAARVPQPQRQQRQWQWQQQLSSAAVAAAGCIGQASRTPALGQLCVLGSGAGAAVNRASDTCARSIRPRSRPCTRPDWSLCQVHGKIMIVCWCGSDQAVTDWADNFGLYY